MDLSTGRVDSKMSETRDLHANPRTVVSETGRKDADVDLLAVVAKRLCLAARKSGGISDSLTSQMAVSVPGRFFGGRFLSGGENGRFLADRA